MATRDHEPPSLDLYLQRRVVLDTPGPMIYIGLLEHVDERGFWLLDADVHDRTDGHSPKEVYVSESLAMERAGTRRVNRRRVFVERHSVISVSALEDAVTEDLDSDSEGYLA